MGVTEFYRNDVLVGELDFIEPNLNLLAHAQTLELEVGSRCGGHGKCGGDRVKILSGSRASLSEITEIERGHLSRGDLEKGYRLACQCFPNDAEGALKIEVFPTPAR